MFLDALRIARWRAKGKGAEVFCSSYPRGMALHIEDPELVADILAESEASRITPEQVVRRALVESRRRTKERYEDIVAFLESSSIPEGGRTMTQEEEAEILGYGPNGLCSS